MDCAIQVSPEDDLEGEQDDEVVALAKKGEINHHEVIAKYWDFT